MTRRKAFIQRGECGNFSRVVMINRTISARHRRSTEFIEDCFVRVIAVYHITLTTDRCLKRFGHFRQAQRPISIETFSYSQLPGKQLAGQYGN